MAVVKNPADNQEVFDFVVNALRKQGCKSEDSEGCLYRGPNGTKCAAGHLIPNEDYRRSFEGKTSYYNDMGVQSAPAVYLHDAGYNCDLVTALQGIHDTQRVEDWENSFKRAAKDYKLIYKEPVCD